MSSELSRQVDPGIENYSFGAAGPTFAHPYLLPVFFHILETYAPPGCEIFEIGAGNGYVAHQLARRGYKIVAIEPSADGVSLAATHYPDLAVGQASIYDDLSADRGRYDVVYALEVIEHLYAPRALVKQAKMLLKPGGHLCLSTPFHGYWKNMALALTGKLDVHFTALWDHGHIKFWSRKTLRALLEEEKLSICEERFAGRCYPFSKSMLIVAKTHDGETR